MTLAQSAKLSVERFVFHGVTWEYYDQTIQMLQQAGSNAHVTFDNGDMEIMTNGDLHERANALARLMELYAVAADIDITGLGSATCRREEFLKGLDPDECYYVQTAPPPMAEGSALLDLSAHPPPDLAIEIDVSNSSVPRQPIYAALGVREVWRYNGQQLVYLRLNDAGRYEPALQSIAFPQFPAVKANELLELSLTRSQHHAAKAMLEWVRGGSA